MSLQRADLWDQRSFKSCDILLEGGEGCLFPVHSQVISSSCPYFEMALWARSQVEDELPLLEGIDRQTEIQGRKVVRMPGFKPATVSQLLKYIYTANVDLNPFNMVEVYLGADFLCLDKLEQLCLAFFTENLNLSSSIAVVQTENKPLPSFKLEQIGWNHLLANVIKMSNDENLRAMTTKTLTQLVESDELNATREESVWTLIVRWASCDPEERAKNVPLLALKLRIGALPFNFVAYEIAEHQLMASNNSAANEIRLRNLETNAMISVRTNNQGSLTGPVPAFMKARLPHSLILLMGGRISTADAINTTTDTVLIFDIHTQKWFEPKVELRVPMDEENFRRLAMHKLAFLGKDLYVLGGADLGIPSTKCSKLNLETLEWSDIKSFHHQRISMGATAVDNRLMVAGSGFFQSTNLVEFYDPASDTWSVGPSLAHPRSSAGMVTVSQCVYLVGGVEGFRTLDSVEKFDLQKQKWIPVASLNEPRRAAACVECHGFIFIFGGLEGTRYLRTVERYDPVNDAWSFVSPMPSAKSQMACAIIGECIYLIGGVSYLGNVKCVDVYHVLEDRWTRGVSLPVPRAAAAAATICGLDVCSKLVGRQARDAPVLRIACDDERASDPELSETFGIEDYSSSEDSLFDEENLVFFYWDSLSEDDDEEEEYYIENEVFVNHDQHEDDSESSNSQENNENSGGDSDNDMSLLLLFGLD
ncbi:kelch-like protein 18 [Cloeon dipterum]|uniref:kelch-like protein 18 n=1 Tax=Cloeon dipterum TaxID=197152 RepID=UPI00321FEF03